MTLRIGIGLAFYEDCDSLKRMLDSCKPYPIDMIIAVDGRYKGYGSKTGISSQKCIDLFKSSKLPYDLIIVKDKDQNEKRQVYMDAAKKHDIDCLIVMDSDEYFINDKTNWDLFIEDLQEKITNNAHTFRQAYTIPVYMTDKGVQRMPEDYFENLPRLFHKPSTLQYVDDHFSIRNKKTGVLTTVQGNTLLNHIAMGHDHSLRSDDYTINTAVYEDNLIIEENAIREQRRDDFIRKIQSTR